MENNPLNNPLDNSRMATNLERMAANRFVAIRFVKKISWYSWLILFVAISISFVGISGANAASLYFSPSSGSHATGATLSVSVYVSSADQAMNAASGVISFPSDKLEVTSLSKSGSIFTLWVQEPSFSNSVGTVNFEGIVLNPGFTGSNGKVITITFRTKVAGNAPLTFSSGSALANDGKGTNILTGLGNAAFSLGGATPTTIPEATTPVEPGTPEAPAISSPTHPDQDNWYSNSNPKFNWAVPSGATAVRIMYDRFPNSTPTMVYSPTISEKKLENIKDGIYYFHVQLKNAKGWGEISRFRFKIDTQPPEPFKIKFIDGNNTQNPRPTIVFDTTDSLSGVNYYKIKIGEGDFFNVAPEIVKTNPYTLLLQNPGRRNVLVQAFDKAENYSVDVEEFNIEPLESPVITKSPKDLESGEILKVSGESKYPNSQIIIWLQRERDDPRSYTINSDQNGIFAFVADEKLRDGVYKLWAEAVDARGARSLPSEKITVVIAKSAILRIGNLAVSLLAVIIPLVALIFTLLFAIWYGWHKFASFRKKLKNLRKEVREAESALHKTFDILKEDIHEQVKLLEKTKTKRRLTEEEEKIIKQLRKDLDNTEKFVMKEIKDIEKEVK